MSSIEEDKWMKNIYPKILKLLEARRAGQTNLITTSQSGGKALTRSEQKKIDISGDPDLPVPPKTSNEAEDIYDDPTPGTSTGGTTKPPVHKAYQKTAKKNIVSKVYKLFENFLML